MSAVVVRFTEAIGRRLGSGIMLAAIVAASIVGLHDWADGATTVVAVSSGSASHSGEFTGETRTDRA